MQSELVEHKDAGTKEIFLFSMEHADSKIARWKIL